jgi:laccase
MMIAGDWWSMDLAEVARKMEQNLFDYFPSASTINGKLGDLFNCSGNQLVQYYYTIDLCPKLQVSSVVE